MFMASRGLLQAADLFTESRMQFDEPTHLHRNPGSVYSNF